MNSKFLSLFKAAMALALVSCSNAGETESVPTDIPAVNVPRQAYAVNPQISGVPPVVNPGRFRNPDGSVNYPALHAAYGEPNENIVLNPRAVDVAKTQSIHSVKIEKNQLIFAVADAAWLTSDHKAGDTLYCSAVCGDKGFLRNVLSIRTEGDKVVVGTKDGFLTDILHGGWLHGTQIMTFGASEEEKQKFLHDPRISGSGSGIGTCTGVSDTVSICYNASYSGGVPTSPYTHTWGPYTEPFTGGSIGISPSVSAQITFDIAVEIGVGATLGLDSSGVNVTVDPIFQLSEFSLLANITPSVQVAATYNAHAAFTQDWTLLNVNNSETPAFAIGPLSVDTTFIIGLTAHVDASASVAIVATGEASDTVSGGFSYNSKDGFSPEFHNSLNGPFYTLTASGNANAHASAALNVNLGFTISGLGGATATASGASGIDLNALASNSGSVCTVSLKGLGYYSFSGNATVDFGAAGIALSYPYDFPSVNQADVIVNKTFTTSSALCSTGNFDAGGQEECPSGPNYSLPNVLCGSATPSCCPNYTTMKDACTDEATDNNNCGGCGIVCTDVNGPGSTCSAGACSCTCPAGPDTGQSCPGGTLIGCAS